MDKLKKIVSGALALGLAFALVVPSYADTGKKLPAVSNTGGYFQDLKFYGQSVCRVTTGTTASEGFLDAVCPTGGLAGQYALAINSGIAGSRSVTNSDTLLLSPEVFTQTAASAHPYGGCFVPINPVRFDALVGVMSQSGPQTIIYYHLSSGANP